MRAEAKIVMWTTSSVQDTSQPQVKKRQYLASQGDFSASKIRQWIRLKTTS